MASRVLHLTSPLMSGPDVREIQAALKQAGYLADVVDGEYGPHTAQAVYRAEYRLGYLKPSQTLDRPAQLLAYLSGAKKPGPLVKAAAAKRAAANKAKQQKAQNQGLTHAQLIVQRACTQLGQTESPPDSNRSKFSLWYGIVGAWCAMFVTWVHCSLGFSPKTFKRAVRYAYVPYIVADAEAGKNGLMVASGPADGIVVTYDWNGDGVADHVGIAAEETTLKRLVPKALDAAIAREGHLAAGDFWAVEGNTAVGNDSNGGEVMIRRRHRSTVRRFVKVAA